MSLDFAALWGTIQGLSIQGRVAMVGIAIALVVERARPIERRHTWAGRTRNVIYTIAFFVIGDRLIGLMLTAYTPRFTGRLDPSIGGRIVWVVSYLLIWDLVYYWYHRAQHRWQWLWAIHELHHSDTEVNVTTSLRTHPIEKPIQLVLLIYLPLTILGVEPSALVWAFTVGMVWEAFAHVNVRLNLGLLTPVLCGPLVHRVHHSREPRHRDTNFAQYFTFYDVLFGTYRAPTPGEVPDTGTDDLRSNAFVVSALLRPFRLWGRQLAAPLTRR